MPDEGMNKAWRCKNGHALGLVKRNGSQVKLLYLYLQAVDLNAEPVESMNEVEVIGVLELVKGAMRSVRCSVCDSIQTWGAEREERPVRKEGPMLNPGFRG